MLPFACYTDAEGNVWMTPGPVIALHSTTAIFEVGDGGQATVPHAGQEYLPVEGTGAAFQGGNGTNLVADAGSPIAALLPYGILRAIAPDTWAAEGQPDLTVVWDPGDGSAELSDGTDVVATLAAGSPVPRTATFVATAYGEAVYNGSSPWTIDLTYEGAADPFPPRPAAVTWGDGATGPSSLWPRTGWQTWESGTGWTLTLDGSGTGEVDDGTDVVATRAADATRLYDPAGEWASTSYGAATYGAATEVITGTATAGTWPTQEYQLADTFGTVSTYLGVTDPTKFIVFDNSAGDADFYDESGEIANRSGASTAHPNGTYVATPDGEDAYHGGTAFDIVVATTSIGAAFIGRVGFGRALPAAGVLHATLTLDGSDEVTAVAGPFWASALPANSGTEAHVPILTSDGAGLVKQVQLGPIHWRPA